MNEDELRQALRDVDVELRGPADRLAAVTMRVRRRRHRVALVSGVAAAMAVAMVIAVPWLLAAPGGHSTAVEPSGVPAAPTTVGATPPAGKDGCPATGAGWPISTQDTPGDLVPSGATRITLCEAVAEGRPEIPPGTPRVLEREVSAMVAALNELPDQGELLRRLAETERLAGRPAPTADNLGCTLVGYPYAYSFLLHYSDRVPVLVYLDANCGTAIADGRTRYNQGSTVDRFFTLYRAQLEASTDPAKVATPRCKQAIGAADMKTISDGAGRNRGGPDGILPSTLVAAAFCRYERTRLAAQRPVRTDLDELRDEVNAQFPKGDYIPLDCAGPEGPLPTDVDVVLVADATGAVTEFWLYRDSCRAALRSGFAGVKPRPELLALVDAQLGPVR